MAKNPYRCECLHCQHQWLKRSDNRPKLCPHCKSRIWDRQAMKRADIARKGAAARWKT